MPDSGIILFFKRMLLASFAFTLSSKLLLLAVLMSVAVAIVWRWPPSRQWRLLNALVVALVAVFLLQPGMPSYLAHAFGHTPPSASGQSTSPGPKPDERVAPQPRRVIVLVLDEWDMELSEREQLFATPALQRLLRQSLLATRVSPAGDNTLSSIPAMLTGERFDRVESGGVGMLQTRSGQRFHAGSAHLFNDLRAAEVPFAVTGFYHDYCAVAQGARQCLGEPVLLFPGWVAAFQRSVRGTRAFDYPYSDFMRQWQAMLEKLQSSAERQISDPGNQFVWIHLNIPHPPLAVRGGRPNSLISDYRANLQVMGEWIDRVRTQLQASGQPVAMLLTSDHWLRERELWHDIYERQRGPGSGAAGKSDDHRVPLIVWFSDATPGGVEGTRFDEPVDNTTLLRSLVLALLGSRVDSPATLAEYLRTHPSVR